MELDINTRSILDAVSGHVRGRAGGEPDGHSVVDVGCGEGRLLRRFKELGFHDLSGVGYSIDVPDGVRGYARIDLSEAGWADRLQGNRFRWVISTEVIEHLVNPYQFLLEIRRIVKDDGSLILTFPNIHNLRSIIGFALKGRFSGFFGPNWNQNHPLHDQHIFIPNMHLVRYFLGLAGFDVDEIRYVNGRGRLFGMTTMVVAKPRH